MAVLSLIVNFALFEPTARWAIGRLAGRAGFEIGFGAVEGNLYSGRFGFRELTVRRTPGERAGFDLAIAEAAVDIDLRSILFRPVRLERVELAGLEGRITKQEGRAERKLDPARSFVIDDLAIRDARLEIRGADGTHSEIEFISASSRPLRSDFAVFDFFFRSNIDARVDGNPVLIATGPRESGPDREGRHTSWMIEDFPTESVAGLVPLPPSRWFNGGTITAELEDNWEISGDRILDNPTIHTEWIVTMRSVTVAVLTDAGALEKIAAAALAKVVNGREEDVTLSFALDLDEDSFRRAASLDAAGFWAALMQGFREALAAKAAETGAKTREKAGATGSSLKSLFGTEGKAGE